MHSLEILQKCGKRVITKGQKIREANYYICRKQVGGKTGRGPFLPSILSRLEGSES